MWKLYAGIGFIGAGLVVILSSTTVIAVSSLISGALKHFDRDTQGSLVTSSTFLQS